MFNFMYNARTKVYFGKNALVNIEKEIKDYNSSRVLICYGKGSIIKLGILDFIKDILNKNNIKLYELKDIKPNPDIDKVREGVKIVKDNKIDLIIACGGGSVIDTAKAIGVGALVDFDPWLFNTKEKTPKSTIPLFVVLTISAAGSEMSNSCVISNKNIKTGFNSEVIRPKVSFLDPSYTYTVSKYQTACGIVDILMHTLERLISSINENNSLTDNLSYGLIKSVIEAGYRVIKDPHDYDSRATIMWASSLSHNGLTGCGKNFIMRVHQLEHALSGEFSEIAHGAGLAILWPAWALYILNDENRAIFEKLGKEVFNLENEDSLAEKTIVKFRDFFKEINMPISLSEVNVTLKDIEEISLNFSNNKKRIINDIVDLDHNACMKILLSCL